MGYYKSLQPNTDNSKKEEYKSLKISIIFLISGMLIFFPIGGIIVNIFPFFTILINPYTVAIILLILAIINLFKFFKLKYNRLKKYPDIKQIEKLFLTVIISGLCAIIPFFHHLFRKYSGIPMDGHFAALFILPVSFLATFIELPSFFTATSSYKKLQLHKNKSHQILFICSIIILTISTVETLLFLLDLFNIVRGII